MPRIEERWTGVIEVVDDDGQVLQQTWDPEEARQTLAAVLAECERREAEDRAGRIFGL